MAQRKDLMPTIATSLARMSNAESPSLRRKVERLKMGAPIQNEDNNHATNQNERDPIRDGIEHNLWNLMAAELLMTRR
jgi:hypothetical protein